MTLDELCEYFGSGSNAAKALGFNRAAFSMWNLRGYIPLKQQVLYEALTDGVLKADFGGIPEPKDERLHLPAFKYESETHGLCDVQAIHFRPGKPPKIVCVSPDEKRKTFCAFNSGKLLQATPSKDEQGNIIYKNNPIRYVD